MALKTGGRYLPFVTTISGWDSQAPAFLPDQKNAHGNFFV